MKSGYAGKHNERRIAEHDNRHAPWTWGCWKQQFPKRCHRSRTLRRKTPLPSPGMRHAYPCVCAACVLCAACACVCLCVCVCVHVRLRWRKAPAQSMVVVHRRTLTVAVCASAVRRESIVKKVATVCRQYARTTLVRPRLAPTR